MMMDFDVGDLVREFAQPHKVLSSTERHIAARLCEATKACLLDILKDTVASAGHNPCLMTYSSDGTPLKTQERFTHKMGSGPTVYRKGGSSLEFLSEKVFVKHVDIEGRSANAVYFRDPLPLLNGKSGWAIYAAGRELIPTLRELGHRAIAVSHYCFDRALYSFLDKRFRELHQHLESFSGSSFISDAVLESMLPMLNWVVSSACCNHDAHNALKWAMLEQMGDPQLLKDLCIVLESLRNSYDLLHGRLAAWVHSKARFVEVDGDDDAERSLWTSLGIEPEVVELLVRLRLRFTGGALLVINVCANEPDVMNTIFGVLLHVLRIKRFTDSRWCTVGQCCRTLVASLLLGIDDLVAVIRSGGASDYFIGGFMRLTPDMKRFCVICAFSSYVSDGVLGELLEDDRIVRRAT